MSRDEDLRDLLVEFLSWPNGHVSAQDALADIPRALRGKRPPGAPHTPWQLLEHMRIAQRDILDFCRNAEHVSPEFPDGYWPPTEAPPNQSSWDESVSAFLADIDAMKRLVADASTDVCAPLPHTDGVSLLREALLVADHNAYHLGQIVLLRRVLAAGRREP